MICPACSSRAPEGSAFCSACGATLDGSEAVTRTTVDPSPSFAASSDLQEAARFLPGATFAGRYRIAGLVGRGGMGEVYRADDLKLGQPVALKFLPADLAQDPERLGRLLSEVRVARQVSHPNVCRVYDAGEFDGQHYLSMEYVDGEDLGTLLRRIGHLPKDKAIQIARQLCAGLAAAHDQGILHRDLKPANVMVDGRGRARLTDFGLAGLADSIRAGDVRSGTPTYMAPEQLEGREVTVRSDVYALGLVLYELFTGRKPFERGRDSTTPTSPSSVVDGFDPAVERVLLHCLDHDPAHRPPTALAVAAALPGGDPLAAALAAGETPSPEMVAAAGPEGGLRPRAAAAWFSVLILALPASVWVGEGISALHHVPFERSFAALQENGRRIATDLGYDEPGLDRAGWIGLNLPEYFHQLAEAGPGGVAEVLRHPAQFVLTAHYRQAPGALTPLQIHGLVGRFDPAPRPGDLRLVLDLRGRLIYIRALPPLVEESDREPTEPAWDELFEFAGLDMDAFEPVTPTIVPETYADTRAAWTGVMPDHGDRPVRIEAASLAGKPVYFEKVISSDAYWSTDEVAGIDRVQRSLTWLVSFILALILTITAGGAFLVVRNLRMGRGDRRGAVRVALAIFALRMLDWILGGDHSGSLGEINALMIAISGATTLAVIAWMVYLAAEPYVRRLWPDAVVSWSRLIAGRITDPLVGRDLLIGSAMASVVGLISTAIFRIAYEGGLLAPIPTLDVHLLRGGRFAVGQIVSLALGNFAAALGFIMIFLLLRMLFRRTWIATVVLCATWAANGLAQIGSIGEGWALGPGALLGALSMAFLAFVLVRFGLVALVAYFVTLGLLQSAPFTFDSAEPYFGVGLVVALLIVGFGLFGFKVSLAGRPLMPDAILDS